MKNYKRFIIALVTIFVIVNLVWFLSFFLTQNLVSAARQHLDALASRNVVAAWYSASRRFQKEVSLAEYTRFVRKYPVLQKNGGFFVRERYFRGNRGKIIGEFADHQRHWWELLLFMVYEDEKWKVLTFRIRPQATGETQDQAQSETKARYVWRPDLKAFRLQSYAGYHCHKSGKVDVQGRQQAGQTILQAAKVANQEVVEQEKGAFQLMVRYPVWGGH